MSSAKNNTQASFPLNIQDIKKLLPHRYPFLMVDKVLSLTEKAPGKMVGRVCKTQKNVTGNEPFFEGHFPENPIMPGVLMLEAIAQTGALCCSAMPGDAALKNIFFAGVDKVRFKQPVYPGDVLDVTVEMKKSKADFFWGEGLVSVEGQTVVSASILAHITFQNPK